ncbi:hypothetical protein EVAR_9358_1 [Eumeta japonica]|uniref:Uncharacterized protein n=1 Tax=Eumeta variegata TaxID=151549 RepID=A0A4C1YT39_EUMVA|nr:hypothetical protein EVAR_9358_1 [Eumeta japonica]
MRQRDFGIQVASEAGPQMRARTVTCSRATGGAAGGDPGAPSYKEISVLCVTRARDRFRSCFRRPGPPLTVFKRGNFLPVYLLLYFIFIRGVSLVERAFRRILQPNLFSMNKLRPLGTGAIADACTRQQPESLTAGGRGRAGASGTPRKVRRRRGNRPAPLDVGGRALSAGPGLRAGQGAKHHVTSAAIPTYVGSCRDATSTPITNNLFVNLITYVCPGCLLTNRYPIVLYYSNAKQSSERGRASNRHWNGTNYRASITPIVTLWVAEYEPSKKIALRIPSRDAEQGDTPAGDTGANYHRRGGRFTLETISARPPARPRPPMIVFLLMLKPRRRGRCTRKSLINVPYYSHFGGLIPRPPRAGPCKRPRRCRRVNGASTDSPEQRVSVGARAALSIESQRRAFAFPNLARIGGVIIPHRGAAAPLVTHRLLCLRLVGGDSCADAGAGPRSSSESSNRRHALIGYRPHAFSAQLTCHPFKKTIDAIYVRFVQLLGRGRSGVLERRRLAIGLIDASTPAHISRRRQRGSFSGRPRMPAE